jgi:hypothetical protein
MNTEIVIAKYKAGLSGPTIAASLDMSNHAVYKILYKEGIVRSNKENYAVRFNESFFETIDTEQKAYFLGFIAADGCIIRKRWSSGILKIDIKETDKKILYALSDSLSLGYDRIKEYQTGQCKIVRVVVPSDKLTKDLAHYGIVPRKTFTFTFPEIIPDKLIRHFIRGYFDGDGCITVGPVVKIVGTENFLLSIQNKIMRACRFNHKTKLQTRHPERHNNIRSLEIGGRKKVQQIYRYFYDDATIFLERKKLRFMELLCI